MNANNKEYYKMLGVDKNATKDDIKKSFRKLSLKHHPDKGGDVNEFKKLTEAYETLGDEEKRQQYDNPSPFHGINQQGPGGIPSDIFEAFFGGGGIHQGQGRFNFMGGGHPNIKIYRNGEFVNMNNPNAPPASITQTLYISIEEAYTGCSKPVEIERWIEEESIKRIEKETIYVDVNEGVDNNETIIVKEQGNILSNGNKGDIRIVIKINNETEFIREGLNLIYKKKLSLKECLCGFSFNIKHLNSKDYQINNKNTIIKPNYKKVCQCLGMKRGNHTGNMYIFFDVDFPETLTDEQVKELERIL